MGVLILASYQTGMLWAHDRLDAQLAYDADDGNGDVRAIGPVTQIFRECFLSAVDDYAEGDLRHS